jgi:hypothetical protein
LADLGLPVWRYRFKRTEASRLDVQRRVEKSARNASVQGVRYANASSRQLAITEIPPDERPLRLGLF